MVLPHGPVWPGLYASAVVLLLSYLQAVQDNLALRHHLLRT